MKKLLYFLLILGYSLFALADPLNYVYANVSTDKSVNVTDYTVHKMGDINCDGNITSADARMVLRIAVGISIVETEKYIYCDCDFDGIITASDARIVLRTSVGLDKPFFTYEAKEFAENLAEKSDTNKLFENLISISDNIGSRWYTSENNHRAYKYILGKLSEYGFSDECLITDGFYIDNTLARNIYAKIPTSKDNPEIIVISAHYDSAQVGNGCIDNATGVSSLLETARILNENATDYGCEIRFCFFSGEEIGYKGAYRYCWYISQNTEHSAASIERHKYIINLDMTAKPSVDKNYYLCISTEPVSDSWKYRKAEQNSASRIFMFSKSVFQNCLYEDFYCPVSAGKHDLQAFREYGLEGITISWREISIAKNSNDYNLIPPDIIHTQGDTTDNINFESLFLTTEYIILSVAIILFSYQ